MFLPIPNNVAIVKNVWIISVCWLIFVRTLTAHQIGFVTMESASPWLDIVPIMQIALQARSATPITIVRRKSSLIRVRKSPVLMGRSVLMGNVLAFVMMCTALPRHSVWKVIATPSTQDAPPTSSARRMRCACWGGVVSTSGHSLTVDYMDVRTPCTHAITDNAETARWNNVGVCQQIVT